MNLPPISTEVEENVVQLKVSFKEPISEERFLVTAPVECCHFNGPFLIDEKEAEVTCGRCNKKLNPIWVLAQLLNAENRWHATRKTYQEEMKRLAERSRTKCQHCGEMTRISRK